MSDLRSLVDLIGDPPRPTPIARLERLAPDGVELGVKLEWTNPFGSVKDRPAKWMLSAMRERGEFEGRTVLEPTSGNTGIALAAICALWDLPMTAIVPYSMPAEKSVLLRALGAEVVPTPVDVPIGRHPMDVAMDVALEMLARDRRYVMPNQYDNPDNSRAHYESTAPEIWGQTDGSVRYFFAGIGTGGTVSGVGRYLKERDPSIRVIAIEPVMGHHISGLKNLVETNVPAILDRSVIDEVVYVDDAETAACARRLHAEEALFGGSSTCACVAGALKWFSANPEERGTAVAIGPDSSQKAISYLQGMLGDA